MNERAFLAQLESANTEELSQLLRRPTAEEERVLEIYFGRARLQRLRGLALRTQQRAAPRGNVVVLHGIMGGEITVYPQTQKDQHIWLSYPRLAIGAVGWLRMVPKTNEGRAEMVSEFTIKATGILKKWYSDMLMELAADRWNVRAFWFDWRLDLKDSAKALHDQINEWFGDSAAVNLVAHSMGGLVARTYVLNHKARWDKGGKLIMLGTPNHGSFAIPQVITGLLDTVRKLAIVDITHSRRQLCAILNSFPGSIQMLPSPLVMEKKMERMYRANEWGSSGVTQDLLNLGRASHERLEKVVYKDRMAYIAGYNQVTQVDVKEGAPLDDAASYVESLEGDGTVPHKLGFKDKDGTTDLFPTYFVECEHGGLPNHPEVIAGTKQLLVGDDCSLPDTRPTKRGPVLLVERAAARKTRELAEEEALRELSRKVRGRTRAAGGPSEAPVANDEIKAAELLVRSFLVHSDTVPEPAARPTETAPPDKSPPAARKTGRPQPAPITIALIRGGIQEEERLPKGSAIAVGHYIGVTPQNAELALDVAISKAIPKKSAQSNAAALLITELCRRGVFVGDLGQNFFLPDPRDLSRVVVLAGMGHAGSFGEAELAVLARELVWTLGRSARKNLFTVLIGAGVGNLGTATAVRSWLRGVRRALYDAVASGDPTLERITFVEYSQTNFVRLDRVLDSAVGEFAAHPEEPIRIHYDRPTKAVLATAERAAEIEACNSGRELWRKSLSTPDDGSDPEPIRLTVQLRRDTYEFAALTEDASIPQRETQIDPVLVDEVNNQLPVAETPAQQLDRGHLLEKLLLPGDLRGVITRQVVPVVLAVDRDTARIHWEMLSLEQAGASVEFQPQAFLGARAGLTRQLRTTFAQLPEPPMLTGRLLRVLVVADPAEDAPLPGAQEEGEAVAAIWEEFGRQPDRAVEVVRLFGPGQATRVAVLDQLVNHRFDVLHFAGHCFFNPKDQSSSGWVFSNGHVLSAHELSRVDRVPRFVFSNACESGITGRPDKRNAAMAPSFAEAFFARGVANFVCTAWPVGDAPALAFARRVYRGTLGLRGDNSAPEPLHKAMAAARQEIAGTDLGGLQTWGAYQHYGDPNFRFIPRGETPARPTPATSSPAPKKRRRPAKTRTRPRARKH